METLKALETRRSVRGYLDKEVENDKLEAVVKACDQAPNTGPIQATVITNKDCLKEINDATKEAMLNSGIEFMVQRASLPGYQPIYNAPAMIVISVPEDGHGNVNAACAATAACIAATDQGLGSCYLVSVTFSLNGNNELAKKLELKEGYKPMVGVIVGYQGEDKFSPPKRELPFDVNYIK